MIELCASTDNLPRDWKKTESPDWTSDHDIGLEIISMVPEHCRELFGFKYPAKKTLAEAAAIVYKSNGFGFYQTRDGEIFRYCYRQKLIVSEAGTLENFNSLDDEGHRRFDDAQCLFFSYASHDIGNEVYDYISLAKEGFSRKLSKLNEGHFTSCRSNRLAIITPVFGDYSGTSLYQILDFMIESQKGCERKFDIVYLRLMGGIAALDLNARKIDWYWVKHPVDMPIEEDIRRCMESPNGYSLSDMVTIPVLENDPIHVDEETPGCCLLPTPVTNDGFDIFIKTVRSSMSL